MFLIDNSGFPKKGKAFSIIYLFINLLIYLFILVRKPITPTLLDWLKRWIISIKKPFTVFTITL